MVASDSFAEFVREQLVPLGRVTMRRMFGKTGVFCDGADRAQTPSRSLPLSVHAERSRFRGALSTKASLLPLGAFGLVPPLHDDRPQISVPMTTISECTLTIGNTGWGV